MTRIRRLVHMLVFASVLAGPVLALGACNTIQGAGKDVERAGEWTQKKAQDAKD